jgi:hypothetical protein
MNKIILLLLLFLLLILLLLTIFILIFFKLKKKDTFNIKYGPISVIILSYNRPFNLIKSLPILNKSNFIDEIIILHGNPQYYVDFKYDKVTNIKDYKNNELYGGARRFLANKYVKNNIILLLDDDMIPTENFINKLYQTLIQNFNRNTIYGNFKRNCDSNGYNTKIFKKYNTILTGLCLCKKDTIDTYVKLYFNKFKDWFLKHKGNCEDLSFNIFIRNYYKEFPIFVKGDFKILNNSEGYSSNKQHYQIRSEFCKKYNNY